jgi:phosphoribulokinase
MYVVKADTQQYFEQLIWEGSNTGEIQSRLYLSSYYKDALWNMLLSVVNFWQRDQSAFKERTDVYIEKSVHFTVDLLSPNALDSGFDLIQQFIKWR